MQRYNIRKPWMSVFVHSASFLRIYLVFINRINKRIQFVFCIHLQHIVDVGERHPICTRKISYMYKKDILYVQERYPICTRKISYICMMRSLFLHDDYTLLLLYLVYELHRVLHIQQLFGISPNLVLRTYDRQPFRRSMDTNTGD